MTTSSGSFTMSGGIIDSEGYGVALLSYTKAIISGGEINACSFALSGNGNYQKDVIIYDITGGTLKSTTDFALYLPNNTNTSISGTAQIEGDGAIAIQSGTLTIKDSSKIIAHGTKQATIPVSGDGTAGLQYSCVAAPARYGVMTVNIEGGTFTSGTYSNIIDVTHKGVIPTVDGENYYTRTISVTGGTFDQSPAAVPTKIYTVSDGVATLSETQELDYVADGYTSTQNNDNTWTVSQNSGD